MGIFLFTHTERRPATITGLRPYLSAAYPQRVAVKARPIIKAAPKSTKLCHICVKMLIKNIWAQQKLSSSWGHISFVNKFWNDMKCAFLDCNQKIIPWKINSNFEGLRKLYQWLLHSSQCPYLILQYENLVPTKAINHNYNKIDFP